MENNQRITIFNSLYIFYLISFLFIILTNFVSADMYVPPIIEDDPKFIIILTMLVNIPINFIIFYLLLRLSYSIKSNQVYKIKPIDFIKLILLIIILLSVVGALIDFIVLTSYDSINNTYELNFNPNFISFGLIVIWLSFFLPTWKILNQKLLTSIIISTGIILINLTSWAIMIHINVSIILPCIIVIIWSIIIFFVLVKDLFKWYTKQYTNYPQI